MGRGPQRDSPQNGVTKLTNFADLAKAMQDRGMQAVRETWLEPPSDLLTMRMDDRIEWLDEWQRNVSWAERAKYVKNKMKDGNSDTLNFLAVNLMNEALHMSQEELVAAGIGAIELFSPMNSLKKTVWPVPTGDPWLDFYTAVTFSPRIRITFSEGHLFFSETLLEMISYANDYSYVKNPQAGLKAIQAIWSAIDNNQNVQVRSESMITTLDRFFMGTMNASAIVSKLKRETQEGFAEGYAERKIDPRVNAVYKVKSRLLKQYLEQAAKTCFLDSRKTRVSSHIVLTETHPRESRQYARYADSSEIPHYWKVSLKESFHSSSNSHDLNFRGRVETDSYGKRVFKMPGGIDAILSPDMKVLTLADQQESGYHRRG